MHARHAHIAMHSSNATMHAGHAVQSEQCIVLWPACSCELFAASRLALYLRTFKRKSRAHGRCCNKVTAKCSRMISTAGERLPLEKWRSGHRQPPCRPAPTEHRSLQTTFPLVRARAEPRCRPGVHDVEVLCTLPSCSMASWVPWPLSGSPAKPGSLLARSLSLWVVRCFFEATLEYN